MAGEISYFRKRFLGGFNREDVIDYIEKLAQERNKLQAEKAAAEQAVSKLAGELETLRHEVEEARKTEFEDRENKIAAVIAALKTFADLETTLSDLSQDVFRISERAREEFNTARSNIAELPVILEQADKRFAEILTVFGDVSAADTEDATVQSEAVPVMEAPGTASPVDAYGMAGAAEAPGTPGPAYAPESGAGPQA